MIVRRGAARCRPYDAEQHDATRRGAAQGKVVQGGTGRHTAWGAVDTVADGMTAARASLSVCQ